MTIRRSSEASVSLAVSARASEKLVPCAQRASIKGHRLRRRLAVGAQHDLVDPRLRLAQLRFAMPLQQRAALIGGERVIELGASGLQPLDDVLELLQGVLEAELGDLGRGFRGLGLRHGTLTLWAGPRSGKPRRGFRRKSSPRHGPRPRPKAPPDRSRLRESRPNGPWRAAPPPRAAARSPRRNPPPRD